MNHRLGIDPNWFYWRIIMLVTLLEETQVKIDRSKLIAALYQAAQALELHEANSVNIQLGNSHSIYIDLFAELITVDYETFA
jgi:hypothetical protein